MSEKIIDFQEGIRRTLEIKVVKKKNKITLRGKRGTLIIYLNLNKDEDKKGITNTLKRLKKKKTTKSMKEITKEECKKKLLDNLNRISPVVFQQNKKEVLKEIENEVLEDIEKEIMSAKSFCYALFIGDIQNPKSSFSYIASDLYFIIK